MQKRAFASIGLVVCVAGVATSLAVAEVQLRFTPKTRYAAGLVTNAVAIGDFDGDDRQDLVVANGITSDVSVLLGNGDGSFATQTRFPAGFYPWSVAIGDLDGDGRQDLAVANYHDNDVSVLLGNGDGSFAAQTRLPAGYMPRSVAIGDFDGDGRQDLAVANYGSHDVWGMLGNGDGSFARPSAYPAGILPIGIAIGDFDGNGRQDLAVAVTYYLAEGVSVLLGNAPRSCHASLVRNGKTIDDGTQVYSAYEPSNSRPIPPMIAHTV